ncbi:hypothetical protein, partial [Frankia casuarinae]
MADIRSTIVRLPVTVER